MSKSDKLTTELFKQKVKDKFNYLEVLEEYTNNKTPILIKNVITGDCKKVRPDNLFRLKRPFLSINKKTHKLTENSKNKIIESKRNKNKKTLDEIESKINNDLYILCKEKTQYINNKKSTIILKCKKCYLEFPISFVNLCAGKGCPYCNKEKRQESKNLSLIKKFLDENNIKYETEYKIKDCKNQRVLPFDIKIEINNKIKLIEYDGEFHDFGYNNNKIALTKTKINDKIKSDFCILKNIPLLRLRYNTFDNYKCILKNFLEL